ncbi:6-phospho-beta-glucosidase [Brassicibacter mesophilus]|uniref:6-phospho-beta-glucosidase n=1 Tax=Brassicibacter mesophilus TaxID=745119 RepID=UPI003D253303
MAGLKIAVIGGGSSYTPELIEGFIKRYEELPVSEIWLVDIEKGKEKLEIVSDLARRMIKKKEMRMKIINTLDRRKAIQGADFVLTQLRVGGLDARANDEKIPLKYGAIGQETVGAGGFAKAIRTIPVIKEICDDIEALSPNAWLINFTNPAGIITEMVLKYTKVKVIGLCNVPISMSNNISKIMDVNVNRIKIDFVGLNHMVYGKEVYLDGHIVTNEVLNKIADGESFSMKNVPDMRWDTDFIKALGMIPCPYHRYYYMKDEMLKKLLKDMQTNIKSRAEQVMEIEKKLFNIYVDPLLNHKPKELEERGGAYYSDAAVSLISAIFNDKNEIHTVNVENNGTIPELPYESVIETNCIVNRNGAHPLNIGKLPDKISGLIRMIKDYEALTIKSSMQGDYHIALQALIVNPLVQSVDKAIKILDEILKVNRDFIYSSYSEYFKKMEV